MRYFVALCILTVAYSAPQYNYPQPSGRISSGFSSHQSFNRQAQSFGSGIGGYAQQAYQGGSSIGGGGHAGNFGQQAHHGHHAAAPVITKNFYIHSAPEEEDDAGHGHGINAGPSHKHYRVVFIKAPAQSSSAAALQLAQSQNEEKTVIYVLSKKTDASDIQANLQASAQPQSKPEVFFIKYKTPEEAQHAQHQIQAQYDALGGTSEVSDEGIAPVQSFIGALGDAGHGAAGHGIGSGVAGGHLGGSAAGGHLGAGGAGHGASTNNAYLPPTY